MKSVYKKLQKRENVDVKDFTRDGYGTIIVECEDVDDVKFVEEDGYEIKSNNSVHILNEK